MENLPKPVAGRLVNTSSMLMACARLHNYVIDNDLDTTADNVAAADDIGQDDTTDTKLDFVEVELGPLRDIPLV